MNNSLILCSVRNNFPRVPFLRHRDQPSIFSSPFCRTFAPICVRSEDPWWFLVGWKHRGYYCKILLWIDNWQNVLRISTDINCGVSDWNCLETETPRFLENWKIYPTRDTFSFFFGNRKTARKIGSLHPFKIRSLGIVSEYFKFWIFTSKLETSHMGVRFHSLLSSFIFYSYPPWRERIFFREYARLLRKTFKVECEVYLQGGPWYLVYNGMYLRTSVCDGLQVDRQYI